uniref:Uncharacterized protein n=1 Tax=Hucho hucho TaxID=62062 RepID=A0A4W5QGP3_9TELE
VITETSPDTTTTVPSLAPSKQVEADNAETLKRVNEVVFPGSVTEEGCCHFVSEILRCILYQSQQLPLTYDQLVYCQSRPQAAMQVSAGEGTISERVWTGDGASVPSKTLRRFSNNFSLCLVPCVLLLLLGSSFLPKELYESLRISSCLRDCGFGWFRPKLDFKVPTWVKRQVTSLSCVSASGPSLGGGQTDWQDYVWFQDPHGYQRLQQVTMKGFPTTAIV